jgi:hypothetical protein
MISAAALYGFRFAALPSTARWGQVNEAAPPIAPEAQPATACDACHKVARIESNQGPTGAPTSAGFSRDCPLVPMIPIMFHATVFKKPAWRHHSAPSRSYPISGVSRLNWICFVRRSGNSNEKDNREYGAFSSADVFDSDGRGTCDRRREYGGAQANWCPRRCCPSVIRAFRGPEPIKYAASAPQRRTS